MRTIFPLLTVALLLVATLGELAAAPTPGADQTGTSAVRRALQHYASAALQTSTDEDELADLVVVPIDASLEPDTILRSRPFVMAEGSEQAFPYDVQRGRPLSEDEARARLARFLDRRGVDPATLDDALTKFDSRHVRRIVPSPTLRATLLMLSGWDPYEATIRAILDGENPSGKPYRSVIFDDLGYADVIATLYEDPRNGRHAMIFGRDFEGELPEQLIPVMIHESLHGGGDNSAEEEIVANILDTISYAEVVLIDPEVAYAGTDLAIFNNLELMALINSTGRGGPGQVGIATSPLGDVFVGPDLGDFDFESIRHAVEALEFYDTLLNSGSPGQQTTAALLRRFPGGKQLGREPWYSEEMLAVIDRGVGKIITPERAVRLAQILGLRMTVAVVEASAQVPLSTDLSLATRPFIPRDLTIFHHGNAKRPGKPLSEAQGRRALADALARADVSVSARDHLLARYDAPEAVALIPDPSLRAATLLLGAWEPWKLAHAVIFDGENPDGVPLQVVFADLRHSAPAARRSAFAGDSAPPAILINSLLVGEPPELLASAVVEGTLLHDDTWTVHEAIAAALLGTIAYADMVAAKPALARAKTWGVMTRNRDLLALLNSASWTGDSRPPALADAIGFLSAPDGTDDVLPGLYADAVSFAVYVKTLPHAARFDRHSDLAAPPVFERYLAYAGIAPTAQFRGVMTYSARTLEEIDAQLGDALAPERVLAAAKALKLGVAAGV